MKYRRARAPIFSGVYAILCLLAVASAAVGAKAATIQGRVTDPLGAAVASAQVTLLRNGSSVANSKSGPEGSFTFAQVAAGRYQLTAEAGGFEEQQSPVVLVKAEDSVTVDLHLSIGPLKQELVVSDSGTSLPAAEVGSSVSVIDSNQLHSLNNLDVSDALRMVPGLQVVQTGERGATTSVFLQGGNSEFNKILIDGIPANDVGGDFEFSNLSTDGVSELEVLRGPNSVLYGSDSLSGVINVTTRHGTTSVPEFTLSGDGGNFETHRESASVSGLFHRFDYFSQFGRTDTQNSLPDSGFHNGTYAGNFGWEQSEKTSVRLTMRYTATGLGDPNALGLYGVPDIASQHEQDTYLGLTIQNQTTEHWHNKLSITDTRLRFNYNDPAPQGIPFTAPYLGTNYLGVPVNLCGANGYCVAGQGILDFGGSYPVTTVNSTTVRTVYVQSDYAFTPSFNLTFGARYENEGGFTNDSGSVTSTERNNVHAFVEGHGGLWHRLFATAGVGFDHNAVYGFAATPRASLAYYLRQPSATALLGETKLKASFGTGIEEPSIFDQGSSLYETLLTLPQGQKLVDQYHVSPINAEKSRSADAGVEQGFWNEKARLGINFFDNHFFNLIEFVDNTDLPQLGVPSDLAATLPFGATINSDSFKSRGAEVELKLVPIRHLTLQGQYTYTSAIVTKSFASSALYPAVNPAFPNIPIGAYSPLVGNRPFSRAPHSGSLLIDYSRGRYGTTLTGYFVSKSDGSTFLSDAYFGNTMLLPNRNLQAGYQLVDLSGHVNVYRGVMLFTSLQNVLDEHYDASFGYPSLPFTFRSGIRITVGGEAWRRQ